MIATEGVGGFYRSFPVTLFANGPHTAILAAVNESLKKALNLKRTKTSATEMPLYFISGGLAGAVAAGLTLPFDVVKTRLQIQVGMALFGGFVSRCMSKK